MDDLRSLQLLSERQASNIISYRNLYGDFLSVYELQAIPGIKEADIANLVSFVEVRPVQKINDLTVPQRLVKADKILLIRQEVALNKKRGYTSLDTSDAENRYARYLGGSSKYYVRSRITLPNDFSIGFTGEKDAGEQLTWNPETQTYGMDFWSFHAAVQNKGNLESLVLGDYSMQFGQGLVLGTGFSMGKGIDAVRGIAKNSTGIRPYTSTLETGFFRGFAATFRLPANKLKYQVLVTPFYSRMQQDARLPSDTTDFSFQSFSSVLSNGLHRTTSELEVKNKVLEQSAGAHIQLQNNKRNLQWGISYLQTWYDATIARQETPYKRFNISGNRNSILGVSGDYVIRNHRLFGEVARSKSGGLGMVGGVICQLDDWMEMALVLRNYERDFHGFYSHGFSENTRNINEKGIYYGIKIFPIKNVMITAYYDKFTFPWLKYKVDQLLDGFEYLGRILFTPNRSTSVHFQFKTEQKDQNINTNFSTQNLPGTFQVGTARKIQYQVRLTHQPNPLLRLKTILQFSIYKLQSKSSGYVLGQDFGFQMRKVKADIRVALFDANYDNRQYVYENDVLYAFSIPALQGQGIRTYFVLKYAINNTMTIWGKISRTEYSDREEIGSGLETITGSQKMDAKIQLRFKF